MKICPACRQTYSDDAEFCPRDGARLAAQASETEAQLAAGLARHFRIVRRLGGGGMGTVFLAEQIGVGNRPVALKVLNRNLLDDPNFLLRFQSEAGSTGRIRHPNVVTIYESAQAEDGTPYIAMELLGGESLHQALQRRGALPVPEVAEILQQAARGLNAAHKLGIIHRDLKPDNIFLTSGDEGELIVKVVDFGIAKLRESPIHTQRDIVLGTPAYMSYEQASGMRSDELDARSDVYSLGIVVYEMLSGRVPFHSDTPLGYLRKHMMEEPPPFRAVAQGLGVPPAVESAVMKALVKDRDQRYPSALEFARDFARAASAPHQAEPSELATTQVVDTLDREGAEQERLAHEKAEAERREKEKAAGERAAREKAEQERLAREKAEAERREQEKAAAERAAREKAAPQPRMPPKPHSQMRFVALGLVLLAVVAGGIWYFSRPASGPSPNVTSPPSGSGKSAFKPGGTGASASMAAIPGATFTMGRDNASDPEETPAHPVSVAAFDLDKSPVTNAQYAEFVKSTSHAAPSAWANGTYPEGQAEWPVTGVSWEDANAYCTSKGLRLPTEAEWEYAARGTDGRLYPWGNDFSPGPTNSAEAALGHPEAVGAHRDAASPFGLLDMSGNVWEWTADDYKPYPGHQPTFAIPADAKVIRGGSYQSDKLHVTTTTRNLDHAYTRSAAIGFRCAK